MIDTYKHHAQKAVTEISNHYIYLHSVLQSQEHECLLELKKMLSDMVTNAEQFKTELTETGKEFNIKCGHLVQFVDEPPKFLSLKCLIDETAELLKKNCHVVLHNSARDSFIVLRSISGCTVKLDDGHTRVELLSFQTDPPLFSPLAAEFVPQQASTLKLAPVHHKTALVKYDEGSDSMNQTQTLHKSTKKVVVTKDYTQNVRVAEIRNPLRFYVHNMVNVKVIEKIEEMATRLYNQQPAPETIEQNMVYLVKMQGRVYRARVTSDPKAKSNVIVVKLIDNGLSCTVDRASLRVINDALAQYPEMIIKCALYNVKPPNKHFSELARTTFKNMTNK